MSTAVRMLTAYDEVDDMLKVKSMQKKFRESFVGSAINTDNWETVLGTGASNTVASGTLTMASGTTINADSYLLSKERFTVPFKLSFNLTLSQRIANQTFYVEAVSIDTVTGIPDGKNSVGFVFDGTTATTAKYRVQNGAMTPLDGSNTFPTTAVGSYYEVEPFVDEAWFHGGTMDSTTGRSNSYRRHQQIADPNSIYKIRLRWLNGATAPATTTNAVLQYIACSDYAELTAEITSGRGQTVAGQGIGVNVTSAIPAGTNNIGDVDLVTLPNPTPYALTSLATTNAVSVKSTAGTAYLITVDNVSASARYLKLYNLATAPTVGTSVPILTIPLPATSSQVLNLGALGKRFSTGIAIAITGAMVYTDTTVIVAGDVHLNIDYV